MMLYWNAPSRLFSSFFNFSTCLICKTIPAVPGCEEQLVPDGAGRVCVQMIRSFKSRFTNTTALQISVPQDISLEV